MTSTPKTSHSDQQEIQEAEYSFPYHYVSRFKGGFNQTFNWTWGLYHASSLEFLLTKINELSFNSIADIGCGDGRLARELSTLFPEKNIVGIDYSRKAIQMAQVLNPLTEFIHLDIARQPLNREFDVITLIEVLEHIPIKQIAPFLTSVSKLLKSTGTLLVTVPHINKPLEKKHFQHFSEDSFSKAVSGEFDILETIHFERITVFSRIINKLLTNRLFILNHQGSKNILYSLYKKHLFLANSKNCARSYYRLQKRNDL